MAATQFDVQSGFNVVARWKAAPGQAEKIADILAQFVPHVRREPGVLLFQVGRDKQDTDQFLFYEIFVDEHASQAHQASAHFKAYVTDQALPLLVERQRTFYKLL